MHERGEGRGRHHVVRIPGGGPAAPRSPRAGRWRGKPPPSTAVRPSTRERRSSAGWSGSQRTGPNSVIPCAQGHSWGRTGSSRLAIVCSTTMGRGSSRFPRCGSASGPRRSGAGAARSSDSGRSRRPWSTAGRSRLRPRSFPRFAPVSRGASHRPWRAPPSGARCSRQTTRRSTWPLSTRVASCRSGAGCPSTPIGPTEPCCMAGSARRCGHKTPSVLARGWTRSRRGAAQASCDRWPRSSCSRRVGSRGIRGYPAMS
jgi:hypothetical protein